MIIELKDSVITNKITKFKYNILEKVIIPKFKFLR